MSNVWGGLVALSFFVAFQWGTAEGLPLQSSAPPDGPPNLIGKVVRVEGIEGSDDRLIAIDTSPPRQRPGFNLQSHPVLLLVPDSAPVVRGGPDGSHQPADIELGSQIAAWFSGPLRLTQPPRAAARYVLLMPIAELARPEELAEMIFGSVPYTKGLWLAFQIKGGKDQRNETILIFIDGKLERGGQLIRQLTDSEYSMIARLLREPRIEATRSYIPLERSADSVSYAVTQFRGPNSHRRVSTMKGADHPEVLEELIRVLVSLSE